MQHYLPDAVPSKRRDDLPMSPLNRRRAGAVPILRAGYYLRRDSIIWMDHWREGKVLADDGAQ